MEAPILEVQNIQKRYGEMLAVGDVSFSIPAGEIFSLLGPNGAGKTTTISMLSGLLTPTDGDARIDGHSVLQSPGRVKQAIGVAPQEIALYPTISARENLAFWGKMYGVRGARLKERIQVALEIAGLVDRADEKVETFSGGMKRRLNIAVGLLQEPKVLFMDEPTVGIDPQSRRRILDTVLELNRAGLIVLYTTHYMEEAEEISHRIGIIDHGELIALGSLDELTRMVGELAAIRAAVDFNGPDPEVIMSGLARQPLVHRVDRQDDSLLIQTRQADQLLPELVVSVNKAGAHLRRLEVQEPDLEAVFLHLTGRALRD